MREMLISQMRQYVLLYGCSTLYKLIGENKMLTKHLLSAETDVKTLCHKSHKSVYSEKKAVCLNGHDLYAV